MCKTVGIPAIPLVNGVEEESGDGGCPQGVEREAVWEGLRFFEEREGINSNIKVFVKEG